MDEYKVPPIEVMIDFVKRYDRRIGLRMLYSRYNIPKHERDKYRELWSKFWEKIPDSFEKELTDASEKREAEENDGDSSAQARETVPAEQATR
jgi:hypothetical protein